MWLPKNNKQTQVFFIEFFLAIAIFTVALIVLFRYDVISETQTRASYQSIVKDAQAISASLLSDGLPSNWNDSAVQRIGLTNNDQRIDEIKLMALTTIDYETTRLLFGTEYDYSFAFYSNNLTLLTFFNTSQTSFGNPDISIAPNEELNDINQLVKIDRAVIVQSQPGLMRLYVWKT